MNGPDDQNTVGVNGPDHQTAVGVNGPDHQTAMGVNGPEGVEAKACINIDCIKHIVKTNKLWGVR